MSERLLSERTDGKSMAGIGGKNSKWFATLTKYARFLKDLEVGRDFKKKSGCCCEVIYFV
jgi:hypothetical protein